jgi:hypothetical protein
MQPRPFFFLLMEVHLAAPADHAFAVLAQGKATSLRQTIKAGMLKSVLLLGLFPR